MAIVYLDGEFITDEERAIPVADRGFLFGDGVFTTVRVSDGALEFFAEHLRRLENNCHELGIVSPRIATDDIARLIVHNRAEQGLWRLKIIITGGPVPRHCEEQRPHGRLVMVMEPYSPPRGPVALATCPFPILSPLAHIKSLSYLDRFWIKKRAEQGVVDDLIVTTPDGTILETAFSNIFWICEDDFFLPATTLPLLPGIALMATVAAAEALEMNVREVEWRVKDVPKDACVLICNVMTGIRSVHSIDGRGFSGEHPQIDALTSAYHQLARNGRPCSIH